MGNCLFLHQKAIKIMKTNGEVVEYKPPMKVHQVLSEFTGHAISDTLPVVRHLMPDTELLGGHLYHLLHLPVPPPEFNKKMLRFSNPAVETGRGNVLRIKLVITKQELEVLLRKGVLINDLVSQLPKNKSTDATKSDGDGTGNCKGWQPLLGSIPEGN